MTEFVESRFDSSDGLHRTFYIKALPEAEPKGIVQIAHGMCEYIDRYKDLMSYLADNGYIVCGNDHLGHGSTVDSAAELGYFAPERGWEMAVNDMYRLTKLMKEQHPGLPCIMIGHSMGSLFARAYAVKHASECAAYIFMGTSDGFESDAKSLADKGLQAVGDIGKGLKSKLSGKEAALGKTAAALILAQGEAIKRIKGDECRSEILDKIVIGKYNERIEDGRTGCEWISRDEKVTEAFAADPLCNFRFTVNGYINLASVMYYVSDDRWYTHLPKDVPMLLLSGTEDPVGSYGKGVRNVYKKLCAYCCDASIKLYEDARHELINEINKEEVYLDILRFIDANV